MKKKVLVVFACLVLVVSGGVLSLKGENALYRSESPCARGGISLPLDGRILSKPLPLDGEGKGGGGSGGSKPPLVEIPPRSSNSSV